MLEDMLLGLGLIAGVFGIQFEDYSELPLPQTEFSPEPAETLPAPVPRIDFL